MATFKPALLVVDFQEDFCPPNGSLPVPDGRSIAPTINTLLSLPFSLKIATRDYHPRNHTSFASNHSLPPYTSTTTIIHPSDPTQSYTTVLWPDHCVQGTPGCELVPELDVAKIDTVLDKGQDERVEMYSAFYDPFKVSDSGLATILKKAGVTHVYVVGLAGDFCVKATAESAIEEGYTTYVVNQGTKPVTPDTWEECKTEMEAKGIKFVDVNGREVEEVKKLT